MNSPLFSYRHAGLSDPNNLKKIRIRYLTGVIIFFVLGIIMGSVYEPIDDALFLHLLFGSLLAPTFLGIFLFYKYNTKDTLGNSQVGIDIFSDHIILHGDHHTFQLPIKNLTIKIEPTFHLKIINSGIIIIFCDGKHYYLRMNKDVDKFLIVIEQLKIKNSTYLISSIAVFVVSTCFLIIAAECSEQIYYDWIITILTFIFVLYRHLPWIYKSENHKLYKEKFKTEPRYLPRFVS